MAKLDRLGWAAGFAFRAYGLRIGVRANSREALERLVPFLPYGWTSARSPVVDDLYSVTGAGEGGGRQRRFNLGYLGLWRFARTHDVDELHDLFETTLHMRVAEYAATRVFLHA